MGNLNCPRCEPCCSTDGGTEVVRIHSRPGLSNSVEQEASEARSAAARAEAVGLHPIVTAGPDFSQCISLIDAGVLEQLPVPWPRLQDLPPDLFLEPKADTLVVAVSHGWTFQAHPDPTGAKDGEVKRLLNDVMRAHNHPGHTICFLDFCSIPQRAFREDQAERTEEEQAKFNSALCCMPSVFLRADAVLHVDMNLSEDLCSGGVVLVDGADLEGSSLLQLGQHVQVSQPASPKVHIFDIIVACDGMSGLKANEITQKLASAKAAGRSCTVELRRMPFGMQNGIPVGQRGWIYLERFVTMVKCAMVDESEFGRVCFSNSPAVLKHIREGSERLRKAAMEGEIPLFRELDLFYQELDQMRFSGTSTDKILDTGERAETDRDAVARIMREMVLQLPALWSEEQHRQRQRQLVVAVNSGDAKVVEALLNARAEVNCPGKAGETCLHRAALLDEIDVAQCLLKHKADVNIQDAHGNCAAHNMFLRVSDHVVDFFELLAPDTQTLEMTNSRMVTPLRRFEEWALTADSGEPFEPAMEYLERTGEENPGLQSEAAFGPQMSVRQSCGRKLCRKRRELRICGHKVDVEEWSPENGEAHVHVLWLSFGSLALPLLQQSSLDHIVRRLRTPRRVKFFAVTRIGGLFRGASMAELQERLLQVVEALDLREKFVFVEECRGLMLGLLTKLRPRLMGALLLNCHMYSPEDYMESPFLAKMQEVFRDHAQRWRARPRNPAELAKHLLSVAYVKDANSVAGITEKMRAFLDQESQDYFDMMTWMFDRQGGEWLEFMAAVRRDNQPFTRLPTVLACGAFAPEGVVVQSTDRLQGLFPQSTVRYIPNSKLLCQVEGREQLDGVVRLVEELLGKVETAT